MLCIRDLFCICKLCYVYVKFVKCSVYGTFHGIRNGKNFSLKLSEHIHIPNIQCIIAFTAFKLMKNVHFKAIFRILPISIVKNWNSAWIDKNTHISGSINATEMCQYFLESSDHGLQLMLTWTLEAPEAV